MGVKFATSLIVGEKLPNKVDVIIEMLLLHYVEIILLH